MERGRGEAHLTRIYRAEEILVLEEKQSPCVAVWPCLVMPDTLAVDGENHLHPLGAVPVKVDGGWKEGSTWCRVNGVWNEATAIAAKVSGSWKE